MKKLFICCLALNALAASAQAPSTMFSQALIKGEATEIIPAEPLYQPSREAIAAKTGSKGDLFFVAKRIQRFEKQPKCGRIVFWVAQPASMTVWPQLGGELNICENEDPPLKECKGQGLVPHTALCANGSQPTDTDEVKKAIEAAFSRGGLTHDQVKALSGPTRKGSTK